jgi:hypothetical protein
MENLFLATVDNAVEGLHACFLLIHVGIAT